MKKNLKSLLAFVLCLSMCINCIMPVFAANENNTQGVTFEATLDTPTISTSTEDQTVVMRVEANKGMTVDGIGLTVVWDSALTLTAMANEDSRITYEAANMNLENGKIAWQEPNVEAIEDVTSLIVATFTVPANTPAGDYVIGVNDIELTYNYGDIWENAATVSTTLTITDEPAAQGYTAGLSGLTTEVSVEDQVSVNVDVSHNSDTVFAAGEVVISYDNTKLSFDQTSSALGTATVKDNVGTLTLEDYGADKNLGNGVYVLNFDAIADGETEITIASAAFVNKENAVKTDLIATTLSPETLVLTINKQVYDVTLPEIFTGYTTITDGEDYTFAAADKDNYDYDSVTATMDGEAVTVIDNGDGTYTIENVTGELVITGSRTEKIYQVVFEGNASADVTDKAATATYNTDLSFTMPTAEGWAYSLDSITIGGTAYTGYSVENSVYTIPGTAITGDIVITVSKSMTEASVTVEGTGAGAAAGYETTVDIGSDYTLTIVPEAGYNYSVTATVAGNAVTVINNGNNTYTIENVTGHVVFTVEKIVVVDGVSVTEYLTLDGTVMWLVKNEITLAENKVSTYNSQNMFWSEEYQAYCYLVIASTLSTDDAAANVGITDGTAVTVVYDMDVNITGKIDASDAQLTYNMYNAMYGEFSADATMEKFFRADVNADGKVNTEDAAAIISYILR